MSMRGVVERAIAGLKRDPGYRLDANLSTQQLAVIVWHRSRQLVRGWPLRLSASARGPVFRGRRVVIEHASQLRAGSALILEDNVFINALSRDGIHLGANVTIGRGATLLCTGVITELGIGIRAGDRVAIGAGSFVAGQGGIRIGNDVLMGPGVRILSENHQFDDRSRVIRSQGVTRQGITIGDDCWIGAGVTIVDGVTVGSGCVVAAGAVVTHDLPPRVVAAGVPAQIMRGRGASSVRVRPAFLPAATDSPARILSSPGTEAAASPTLQ